MSINPALQLFLGVIMQNYYIGIDLGTSSVKLLLVDECGNILNSVSKSYPIIFPKQGWAEQDPAEWWKQTVKGIKELVKGFDTTLIRGVGLGGQMHGLVVLDKDDNIIRPCILWNDGRTEEEVAYLNNEIGRKKLSGYTANIAFAGFTAPKLLWMKKHEPKNFAKIAKIMLPKDYINYKLTGVHCCDYSDASGLLLLDVRRKQWSDEMCRICSVEKEWLPALYESYDVIGKASCRELPFLKNALVVCGAGDNAAAAIGTNTIADGKCNISIGTSGTIFIASDTFKSDKFNALHSFAHASGKYHLMGVALSAASCNAWFCGGILKDDDYAKLQSGICEDKLGTNRVYYLPYLMGERSPINDVNARSCFIGMDMASTREDMILAVLEGVAFAMRDSLEVAKSLGIVIKKSTLCGGGAKSALWQKIFANVLDLQIDILEAEEGPGYGAAMLAMTADGKYKDIGSCAKKLVKVKHSVKPERKLVKLYDQKYETYKKLYPSLKTIFTQL